MSRKIAREVALKQIFSQAMGGESGYEEILEQSGVEHMASAEEMAFARELVEGVAERADLLDGIIAKHAIGWAINRMPRVDLCILRLAIFEMRFRKDIPESVSVNEAVELAKRYSGEKSPSFINGVLGTVSKELVTALPPT